MADYNPIEWNDALETGVDEIDDQHRILVKSFQEANVKLAIKANPALMMAIVRDLMMYAQYHFDTEEELMQKYGYIENKIEEANTHIEQHRSFSDKVAAMRGDLKAGNTLSREALLSFLNDWLVQHILNTDKKLAAFLLASDKFLSERNASK